jgi:hypothetical protein
MGWDPQTTAGGRGLVGRKARNGDGHGGHDTVRMDGKTKQNKTNQTKALFSSEKISDFGTVAISFVCDKYYLIID